MTPRVISGQRVGLSCHCPCLSRFVHISILCYHPFGTSQRILAQTLKENQAQKLSRVLHFPRVRQFLTRTRQQQRIYHSSSPLAEAAPLTRTASPTGPPSHRYGKQIVQAGEASEANATASFLPPPATAAASPHTTHRPHDKLDVPHVRPEGNPGSHGLSRRKARQTM